MTKEEAILLDETVNACYTALDFIEHATPEDFILGEDKPVKEMLARAIGMVNRFYQGDGPAIH